MIAEIEVGNAPRRLYPESVIQEILRRVSCGEDILAICKNAGFPSRAAWHKWIAHDDQLAQAYVSAQQAGLGARHSRKREAV